MCKNLLNWVRNIFIKTKIDEIDTSVQCDKETNTNREFTIYNTKYFDSLVQKLDDELFENCCIECASKILPRFFPNINDMTRRMLTKIYAIKGSEPEECLGPFEIVHGWVIGRYVNDSEMNQDIKKEAGKKKSYIYDRIMTISHEELGYIHFPIKRALWQYPDLSVFSVHSEVYSSFSHQIHLCQKLEMIKFLKIQEKLSNELSDEKKSVIRSDGLSRIKSMRVRFSWVSFKIIDLMLQIEKFSQVQTMLGGDSEEQQEALRYIFSEYLKEMGNAISKKTDSYRFIEYLSKTQGELQKYDLKDIVNIDSRYSSDDEMVQFIKYKNGDIYTCDGHEATLGLYKIPFSKLDRGSGKRGAAFEDVVLEIFRTYLNIDCADSFYIKKKNDNETDAIAWKTDEKVVIVGECKINQRYSNLNISAERAFSTKEGDEGYIVKSVNQLKERMKLIKNGEELKPVKSVNYTIPKDMKYYECVSLSVHASEYIPPMYQEGVHVISLESLVMVLRSVHDIKGFEKYMSFRKECIDKNAKKEFDEFDILYTYCKGNVKAENLKTYACDSSWIPFDISDSEWRNFICGRGKYGNRVHPTKPSHRSL